MMKGEGWSMAINFNQNTFWRLRKADINTHIKKFEFLLIDTEKVIAVFQTLRDILVFTDKRIIAIDSQGLTGSKKTYCTLPYKNIQYYTIETAGLKLGDCDKLQLVFTNSFTAEFDFEGNSDIELIEKTISKYLL